MKIEKVATSAVENLLASTTRIDPSISEEDRAPSLDGYLTLYSRSGTERKDCIQGLVHVQVKGTIQKISSKIKTIKYDVELADLRNFLHVGGAIYFVVYISPKGQRQKIYYNSFLPIKIKKLLSDLPGEQQTKRFQFKEFPTNILEIETLLFSFLENKEKQAMPTYVKLPMGANLEALQNKDMIRGITMTTAGAGVTDPISAMLYEDLYVYANLNDFEQPYPLDFVGEEAGVVERAVHVGVPQQISVGDTVFYDKYTVVYSTKETRTQIGKSVSIISPPPPEYQLETPQLKESKINFTPSRMLRERERDLRFWLSALEFGGFSRGSSICDLSNTDLSRWNFDVAHEELIHLGEYVRVLDLLHVKEDIDINDLTQFSRHWLEALAQCFIYNKPVEKFIEDNGFIIEICDLKIALIRLEENCEPGKCRLYDFFDGNKVVFSCNYDGKECFVPAHVLLDKEKWMVLSNLDCDDVAAAFQRVYKRENDPLLFTIANDTLMLILLAYDESKKPGLLTAAKGLIQWISSEAPHDSVSDVAYFINFCQVAKRERNLSSEEREKLQVIAEDATALRFKIGANLLLEHREAALLHFSRLSTEEQNIFRDWPIYHFVETISKPPANKSLV